MRSTRFPGAELVEKGLPDLANGVETAESLLVSIGAPRLRGLGFDVASPIEDAEERLYLLLARHDADGAHGRYNALVRRLVSFERAAEGADWPAPFRKRVESVCLLTPQLRRTATHA